MTNPPTPTASAQDGTYPRPQLMRPNWRELDGQWDFGFGTDPIQTHTSAIFDKSILVPFPPESPASGIGDTGYHLVAWYRRTFSALDLKEAGQREGHDRVLLHFGAVDWAADVWLNDEFLGRHEGGQSPFSFDISDSIATAGSNTLVVRAVDDPHDVSVPRGKQDWKEAPHSIWYHRTTGIWQPVWLEAVPPIRVAELTWETSIPTASVDLELSLNQYPESDTWAKVTLAFDGEVLGEARFHLLERTSQLRLSIGRQRNGQQYEELLWSPEHPRLIDANVTIERSEAILDSVSSYLGLRSVATSHRQFLLNDRPYYMRSVLSQNYWPESHLAAPDAGALRREVELIKELGFNAARVHQKAEDPRFLYWADKLGLLVWGETASAYEFNARAIGALTTEWMELVKRDRSHPSIVAWVPLNESWGVQHISHDTQQQAFSRAISDLTRALDSTRPVISNDGWEHTASDIWTIHDYDTDPDSLATRYGSADTLANLLDGYGTAGRRISITQEDSGQPIMLTEFGGVSYVDGEVEGSWGYSSANDLTEFEMQIRSQLQAVYSSPILAGFCYTQLTDTGQETNGLLWADRTAKLPIERLRRAILGEE
ncbi:glycoside hydrolase family 2 TIM barrel-domain containing protein [Leifsonia kafniensis]|uniref:Glycoside hydrolase family 2 TIM barrel-domain containing protein n=1 Tax=Leifsonia kafniensis TaxID=475957 RepID=A0ABP7L7J6_9MICO